MVKKKTQKKKLLKRECRKGGGKRKGKRTILFLKQPKETLRFCTKIVSKGILKPIVRRVYNTSEPHPTQSSGQLGSRLHFISQIYRFTCFAFSIKGHALIALVNWLFSTQSRSCVKIHFTWEEKDWGCGQPSPTDRGVYLGIPLWCRGEVPLHWPLFVPQL